MSTTCGSRKLETSRNVPRPLGTQLAFNQLGRAERDLKSNRRPPCDSLSLPKHFALYCSR